MGNGIVRESPAFGLVLVGVQHAFDVRSRQSRLVGQSAQNAMVGYDVVFHEVRPVAQLFESRVAQAVRQLGQPMREARENLGIAQVR